MLKCDDLLVIKLLSLSSTPTLGFMMLELRLCKPSFSFASSPRLGSEISGLKGACKSRGGKGTNSFLFAPTGVRSVCHR